MRELFRISLLLIGIFACAQRARSNITAPPPIQPTPPRNVSDSIVAAVVFSVATHGLPDFPPSHTVFVQRDSDIVSSAALPLLDSVEFILLDSAGVQQLANQLGSVNVIRVSRPIVQDDTAHAGAKSRVVWRQERIPGNRARGRTASFISMSACFFRMRRTKRQWQVDSTLGCIIS